MSFYKLEIASLIARIADIVLAGVCLWHLSQTHLELAELAIIYAVISKGITEVKVTNIERLK